MNKLILGVLALALCIPALAQKKEKETAEETQKRIVTVIRYRVQVRDTTSLDFIARNYSSVSDYNRATSSKYMSNQSWERLIDAVGKFDPTERIIVNDTFQLITKKDFAKVWSGPPHMADNFDAEGNVTGEIQVIPEIKASDICAINFYEEWRIDPVTLEMSKRLLAYTILVSLDNSPWFKEWPLFTVVKDDAALLKLKENFATLRVQ